MADYFEPGFAQIVQAVQEIRSMPFSRLVHTAHLRKTACCEAHCRLADHKHATSTWRSMEEAWQTNFEPGFAQIVQAVQKIRSTPFSRLVHTTYLRKTACREAHCRLADHRHATSTWRSMEEAWQINLSPGLLKSSKPFKRYGVCHFHVWYIPTPSQKRHVVRLTAGWRIINMRLPPGVQWRKRGTLI